MRLAVKGQPHCFSEHFFFSSVLSGDEIGFFITIFANLGHYGKNDDSFLYCGDLASGGPA